MGVRDDQRAQRAFADRVGQCLQVARIGGAGIHDRHVRAGARAAHDISIGAGAGHLAAIGSDQARHERRQRNETAGGEIIVCR